MRRDATRSSFSEPGAASCCSGCMLTDPCCDSPVNLETATRAHRSRTAACRCVATISDLRAYSLTNRILYPFLHSELVPVPGERYSISVGNSLATSSAISPDADSARSSLQIRFRAQRDLHVRPRHGVLPGSFDAPLRALAGRCMYLSSW